VVVERSDPPASSQVRAEVMLEKMVLPETVRLVVVASVDEEFTVRRLVMVLVPAFTKIPSPAVSGERKVPLSIQFEEPDPTQIPLMAKHPPVRLRPLARDDVAADEEKSALEKVVEALVMEKSVVVAKMSDEEPIWNEPSAKAVKSQCF
jgi:hypothetical protein